MTKQLLPLAAALLLAATAAQAQVGIGTTTPNSKAVLDLTSTTKGLLVPRVTQAQRTAIASPPDGLMVFQTDNTTGFWYSFGGTWVNIPNASTAGDNLGNHSATQDVALNGNDLKLNASTDDLNKLAYDATTAGPVLTGATGGVLGYRSGTTTTPVLAWANVSGNSRVGIGLPAGTTPNRSLDVNGGVRLRGLTTAGVVLTDATGVLSSEANQTLSLSGQTLSISGTGGNSVTLPANTDAQTLSVSGQTLSISGGNSVTLPSGGGSPGGAAGGDLTGTYPNPTVAASAITATKLATDAVTNAKVADDAIGIPELSATGTPSATTFLRGDNTWATPTSSSWSLTGNTLDGSQFIGSNNDQDFIVKRNGNEAFRVYGNGRVTLGNNTPSSSSLLLGYNAGAGLSSGNYNTILGSRAGQSLNSDANTLVGYAAGQNVTGYSNTMIGNNAGAKISSGDNNVFIGNQAVYGSNSSAIAIGGGNVVIGASAGGLLNSNSSNNVLIGQSAGASAGLYDAVAIGNNAIVTQSNSMLLGGLRGTNDAVNVGIGVAAPKSTLQVQGTFAVAPVTNVGGGTSGSANNLDQGALNTQLVGGFFTLNPSASTPYYTLPDPASCPGRIYYVRNGSSSVTAKFIVSSGQLVDGAGNTGGTSYDLSSSGSSKSVIMLSDGTNWIVLRTGS